MSGTFPTTGRPFGPGGGGSELLLLKVWRRRKTPSMARPITRVSMRLIMVCVCGEKDEMRDKITDQVYKMEPVPRRYRQRDPERP
jgi:hypothetical protein